MSEVALKAILLLLAVLQLLPIAGWCGASALHRLYAITLAESDALLLMRHRAGLLALPGLLLLWSLLRPELRDAALLLTALSMGSFVLLLWRAQAGAALRRIAWLDGGGLLLISLAFVLLHGG